MTAKTESAVKEKVATARSDEGSPRAGAAEQLTPADPLARQRVLYGVAAYAVARLAWDRRFQASLVMLGIGLAVAKTALKEGAKDLIVGVERYYLHVEPRHLHLRRRRGR